MMYATIEALEAIAATLGLTRHRYESAELRIRVYLRITGSR